MRLHKGKRVAAVFPSKTSCRRIDTQNFNPKTLITKVAKDTERWVPYEQPSAPPWAGG